MDMRVRVVMGMAVIVRMIMIICVGVIMVVIMMMIVGMVVIVVVVMMMFMGMIIIVVMMMFMGMIMIVVVIVIVVMMMVVIVVMVMVVIMIMIVIVIVIVVMVALMRVNLRAAMEIGHIMIMIVLLQQHGKITGVNTGFHHSGNLCLKSADGDGLQHLLKHGLIRSEIKQRGHRHVSADSRIALQI